MATPQVKSEEMIEMTELPRHIEEGEGVRGEGEKAEEGRERGEGEREGQERDIVVAVHSHTSEGELKNDLKENKDRELGGEEGNIREKYDSVILSGEPMEGSESVLCTIGSRTFTVGSFLNISVFVYFVILLFLYSYFN